MENKNQENGVAIAAPIQQTIDKVMTLSPARQSAFIDFGKQGVNIAVLNSNLSILANNATAKFNELPQTITDILAAEETLKLIRKTQADINDARISGVKPITDRLSILMTYEKNLAAPILELTARILAAKKIKEAADNAARLQNDEIKQYQGYVTRMCADAELKFSTYINEQVLAAYNHALTTGNIEPAKIEEFIDEVCKKRGNETHFTNSIKGFDWRYNISSTNFQDDINEHLSSPSIFAEQFRTRLIDQFSDYDLAYQNKAIALQRAKEEADKEAAEIKQTNLMSNTMAAITEVATELKVDDGIKAIKRSYAVDFTESWEESRKISIAFWSTIKSFKDLRMSPFKITPQQMADYLGKMKTADNAFEITGIKWKEVEK